MGPTLSSLRLRWSHPQLREPVSGGVERQLEPKPQDLKSFIQPLITSFTNDIGYSPLKTTSNDALWKAMRTYADSTGVPYEEGSHSWLMFKVGYVYPVVCFPHHPFEVQRYIGIYSWLGLLLDDQAVEYLEEFSMFHQRFCADEKQPIPLLQAWADLMKLTFKYWDPLVANFIVTASLNFLNSNALEARKEFHQIERTKAGRSWAWFLREKDGVGEAYAWFTFPRALCPDISLFLEVVPDISIWIGLTNDVLSFYKEEKAGETHNYVHNRAWYEDKNPNSVFEEIVDEITTKAQQMRLVLKNREPYLKLLNSHLLGYIAFHKLNSRYRLWEVGLGEDATDRTVLGS
ncbi:longiborneol synthase [Fusarium denticulatum]|uniref:Longiborneol synthase n=1 Tax=Fusarium denticulatum TaxID=48507 RepID=A0A8H5U5Q2_9HYPO|nr:longiborneol synthase [Fusarium denticulatum]